MEEKKRAAKRFGVSFILTLLFCATVFGFYTSAVNTETRIKGEDASAWVLLGEDKLQIHLMGGQWDVSLALPNQAAKAIQDVHTVLPREYRMVKQAKSLLEALLDSVFGPPESESLR